MSSVKNLTYKKPNEKASHITVTLYILVYMISVEVTLYDIQIGVSFVISSL